MLTQIGFGYALSPFGYNEFQGAGGGYAVKFSSIAEGEAYC
jgi:hypothetical protein